MKLTEAQRKILASIANNRGAASRVYALGRGTCEALRKRGLVCTHDPRNLPFNRHDGNPFVLITEAGRAALSSDGAR